MSLWRPPDRARSPDPCHVVFSTKHRQPWIADPWRHDLHGFLGGTIKGLGAVPLAIGGVSDHVHLLVGLRGNHAVADIVRELKKASTNWVKATYRLPPFAWQEGYAALSVGACGKNGVVEYISNQEKHHRMVSSRDELKVLLEEAGIAFDESYLE